MKESIKLSQVLPVSAKRLFDAWISTREHTKFTGGHAEIDARNGGRFSLQDGYITGKTISLQPYGRIVQSWRTTDFPASCSDSKLEILFQKVDSGTRITILHSDIPTGQSKDYEQNWIDNYLEPMKKYFEN